MKKTILTLSIFFLFCLSVNATVANPKGEIKAIFSENFDAMTEGSENEPAADELAASSAVDSALTQTPGWAGRGLHQAGGALAVMHFVKKDWFGTDTVQGYIQTPQFDVRLDEGNFAVRFRARTASDKGARIHVEIYDPYTSNNIQAATAEIGAEWTAVQLEMCHPGYGNHLAYLQLASEGEDWLMDDFEIVQDCYTIMPPVVHFPRNVSYTSFTGRWNAVPLADSYLVSVFTTGEKDEREYILTDSATTEYTMVVNGTVKGKDYYYTVRTVGNGFTSDESEPRKVNVPLTSLETPATLEATDVTADGFTARWTPSFRAMGYIISLRREHVAEADESFVILHEDFDKFTSSYSGEQPFYGNLDDYTSMPGWKTDNGIYKKGMFGLDNYWSIYEDISLTSPALDLSAAGGEFTVTVLCEVSAACKLSVTCGDEVQSQDCNKGSVEEHKFTFPNGTASSCLVLEIDGRGTIMFDEITVSQTIKAGESVTENVGTYNTETPVESYEFTGLDAAPGDVFCYSVVAWSYSLDEDGVWGPNVYSESSDVRRVNIGGTTAVDEVGIAGNSVRAAEGGIVADFENAARITVLNAAGQVIESMALPAGTTFVPLQYRGFVIVTLSDGTSRKLFI